MRYLSTVVIALVAMASNVALAVEANEVRGEIVEVRKDQREVDLRVMESGDDRMARKGQVVTYFVPKGTNIEFDLDGRLMALYGPNGDEIGDLSTGDTLLLKFEKSANRMQANKVRAERTSNMALQDRVRREGRVVVVPVPVPVPVQGPSRSAGAPAAPRDAETYAANRLPDSSSPWPLLALLGFVFVGAAGVVRVTRR
jgi:hypothetical protein